MRSSSGSSFWTWLLGAGAAGGLAYLIFDKLTETSSRNPGTSPLGTKTVGGPATGALAGGVLYKACKNDLNAIATRCTLMEDNARKVEREMQKRIAAVVLHPRIGQSFPAIVTGVNQYGTFVRTLNPHVDGMVVSGGKGLDVGDRVTVKLVSTDPQRGFIDFAA